MKTLKFPISLSPEDAAVIVDLQKKQSPMIRSAYKAAWNGDTIKEIEDLLVSRYPNSLDSWYRRCAAISGVGMNEADTEIAILRNQAKIARIFGGKDTFHARMNGTITNEEFKAARLLPLYVIGEAPQTGNRKFEFHQEYVIFKPFNGVQIRISLPKLRKNWKLDWYHAVQLANTRQMPITVMLTATHIYLTIELDVSNKRKGKKKKEHQPVLDKNGNPKPEKAKLPVYVVPVVPMKEPKNGRYAGIDMNPNYIGISIFDDTKLISSKLFDLKDLTSVRALTKETEKYNSNKLEHETREIGHTIGRWLRHHHVEYLYIEELNFKQGDAGNGSRFNGLVNNKWKRNALKEILAKYYKLYEVNAAYSSTIGNVLHRELPDPVAASAEIARRGYMLIQKGIKKAFNPDLPDISDLTRLWKDVDFTKVSDWKGLHDVLKTAKVKYRVPIPNRNGFREASCRRSNVFVLDNFRYSGYN